MLRKAVYETHARVEQAAELCVVVLANADVVTEIECTGDTMDQMTERAMKRKPVEIVIRRSAGMEG